MSKTTTDFHEARVGSVAMECCGACGLPTGSILFKNKGRGDSPEYVGPSYLGNEEARCEFCNFLAIWMAQEGVEPGSTRVGASKLVTVDETGTRDLLAYVPFTEDEDRDKTLVDDTPFTLTHGTVIRCERDGDFINLVEVLEGGV